MSLSLVGSASLQLSASCLFTPPFVSSNKRCHAASAGPILATGYANSSSSLVTSQFCFFSRFSSKTVWRLGFALGLVGAGVAVALQDVLASIAGAFSIGFSKLYVVATGTIGDTRGDGSYRSPSNHADGNRELGQQGFVQRPYRRVPNRAVLKGPIFNYSQGFQFIWDEIKVVLTTHSDCELARNMLTRVAKEVIGNYLAEAQISWKSVSDYYETMNPSLEPTITLVVNGGNLEFGVSYVVDYTKRTTVEDQLFTKIVQEVANSNGKLFGLPLRLLSRFPRRH